MKQAKKSLVIPNNVQYGNKISESFFSKAKAIVRTIDPVLKIVASVLLHYSNGHAFFGTHCLNPRLKQRDTRGYATMPTISKKSIKIVSTLKILI